MTQYRPTVDEMVYQDTDRVAILHEAYPDHEERFEVMRWLAFHWMTWPEETTWELVPKR